MYSSCKTNLEDFRDCGHIGDSRFTYSQLLVRIDNVNLHIMREIVPSSDKNRPPVATLWYTCTFFTGFGLSQVTIECCRDDGQFSTLIAPGVCRTGTNTNEVILRNFLNKKLLSLCWFPVSYAGKRCHPFNRAV